jgi:hypothetical protein
MKYLLIFFSALIIQICSTFFIKSVAEGKTIQMLIFAFLLPILGLPFNGFMVDTKCWIERIKIAISVSLGYVLGVLIVINLIKK